MSSQDNKQQHPVIVTTTSPGRNTEIERRRQEARDASAQIAKIFEGSPLRRIGMDQSPMEYSEFESASHDGHHLEQARDRGAQIANIFGGDKFGGVLGKIGMDHSPLEYSNNAIREYRKKERTIPAITAPFPRTDRDGHQNSQQQNPSNQDSGSPKNPYDHSPKRSKHKCIEVQSPSSLQDQKLLNTTNLYINDLLRHPGQQRQPQGQKHQIAGGYERNNPAINPKRPSSSGTLEEVVQDVAKGVWRKQFSERCSSRKQSKPLSPSSQTKEENPPLTWIQNGSATKTKKHTEETKSPCRNELGGLNDHERKKREKKEKKERKRKRREGKRRKQQSKLQSPVAHGKAHQPGNEGVVDPTVDDPTEECVGSNGEPNRKARAQLTQSLDTNSIPRKNRPKPSYSSQKKGNAKDGSSVLGLTKQNGNGGKRSMQKKANNIIPGYSFSNETKGTTRITRSAQAKSKQKSEVGSLGTAIELLDTSQNDLDGLNDSIGGGLYTNKNGTVSKSTQDILTTNLRQSSKRTLVEQKQYQRQNQFVSQQTKGGESAKDSLDLTSTNGTSIVHNNKGGTAITPPPGQHHQIDDHKKAAEAPTKDPSTQDITPNNLGQGDNKKRTLDHNENQEKEQQQQPKRHQRVAPNVVPSMVFSSSSGTSSKNATTTSIATATATAATRVEPKLDEISTLVLVELQQQKDKPDDIVEVLKRLHDSMGPKDEGDNDDVDERKKNVRSLVWMGTPTVLILTMNKPEWRTNEDIQKWCCACLARLSYLTDSVGRCAIAQSGGVEAIINSMVAYPDSLQLNALKTLMNTFYQMEEGTPPFQSACRFVEELDGLKLLRKALTAKFANNASVNRVGCGLLENLSFHKRFRNALRKSGSVATVGIALENHSDDQEVNDSANTFMKNLSAVDDED